MQDEIKMESHEEKNETRNEKDMRREEAAQRGAANGVSRQNEVPQPVADDWHSPSLFGRDHHRPEASLIPAQQLARKRHQQRQQQQAAPVSQFICRGYLYAAIR